MSSELCVTCGAVKQVYLEQMHTECWEAHKDRTDCPIGLPKIHCQNCRFNPQGQCTYRALELQFKPEGK